MIAKVLEKDVDYGDIHHVIIPFSRDRDRIRLIVSHSRPDSSALADKALELIGSLKARQWSPDMTGIRVETFRKDSWSENTQLLSLLAERLDEKTKHLEQTGAV